MRFSECFEVSRDSEDDWLDPLLFTDTELFVDPFLIYVDDDPQWKAAHDKLQRFFNMVLGLIAESGGKRGSQAWSKAERLLLFPEPDEFALGYSEGLPKGAGSAKGLQKGILLGAVAAYKRGIEEVEHLEELTLFQSGFGADRISDIVCNVLKLDFIRYTQDVARKHEVPLERMYVEHADWSLEHARWLGREEHLPRNPFTDGPVILTPRRFLRRLPTVNPDDFWDWSWSNENETIRGDFNYDIASNVDPETKAQLARFHPDVVKEYLAYLEEHPKKPYDVPGDPEVIVKLWERGETLAFAAGAVKKPSKEEQFCSFVMRLIKEFEHTIEDSNGWQLLRDSQGNPLAEKKVQALMRFGLVHYCKAHDVDLSPESDAGRGPVDFKLSKGWKRRAIIETKLVKNSKFWDGLQKQTVQYMKSEQVKCGYFVAIAYTDADLDKARVERVEDAAKSVQKRSGVKVTPVVVDARVKKSASKL